MPEVVGVTFAGRYLPARDEVGAFSGPPFDADDVAGYLASLQSMA